MLLSSSKERSYQAREWDYHARIKMQVRIWSEEILPSLKQDESKGDSQAKIGDIAGLVACSCLRECSSC